MQIIPTILCGGAGSRLWPVSRELHPKPFIQLSDGQSLLQKAFIRGALIPGVKEIMTVTNRELFFKIQDVYREVNSESLYTSFILEPFGKNTTAAIASSALTIAKKYGDDAVMLVLAADHLIENQDAFQTAVAQASMLAAAGHLVTFGIEPNHPETGYGYIEANITEPINLKTQEGKPEGYSVSRFVEKPSKENAQAFIDSGNYLWNSGMFCFTAGRILEALEQFCPEILQATASCISASRHDVSQGSEQTHLDSALFAEVPDNSIDYAVMEPASHNSKVAVVPCNIGWSDIGSWRAIGDLSTPDEAGNRVEGQALIHESSNCYIQSNDRLVGAVGVDDLIIIDTPDALLVANNQRAQDVKHVYAELKARGHETHKLHRTVHRPWGTYTVLEEGTNFKIKRIEVKPGASLSLQMHHHRSEHWIVVSGMAKVVNGDQEMLVGTNQSTYIPAGHRHRLENPGVLNLVMIEVQSGEYLGEDDIIRFEDNYGRV
ncbi:mannose-1-phosphate guanylyltransferase/mannose-6-phosphate isomerase [Legionella genomosp. 1]|uniref:mannose-1-phosphate guanylyltransferase/mannose-6-phosphate isomerase n=1 Tax=Legionella genomosp. 1 TaxID=1093625 RepID=UPI001054394D|nr:mannose-1-phosphate guanylyltransferase/mannose-6-phosphate isomerase [Legionella genomosp. 1]